ncbi:MAG: hypothetical protein EYC69_12470 [Bacteroidetes bacterium]|nr:MAG: hypothetical protein EYC69_12470 [Bacteroidota bacterium]
MTKLAVSRTIAIILLVLNLSLISLLLFKKPPRPEGPRNLIIERLAMDENQVSAYDELIKMHQDQIRLADLQIIKLKKTLYSTLHSDSVGDLKDSLIYKLADAQSKIEEIHYKHFIDIKKLCKPDQIPRFELLTQDLANYFSPKERRRK